MSEYTPLPADHVRLLSIQPGDPDDELQASLEPTPFPTHIQYEALSYVWGSEEDPAHLEVEMDSRTPRVTITRNLETALIHLRDTHTPRCLWIDALCIDQSSTTEKSAQVALMGDIYRRAARVVAWLGPAATNSDRAMDYMDHIGQHVLMDFNTGDLSAAPEASDRDIGRRGSSLSLSDGDADALCELLSRPWFERLWIRQEIYLAQPGSIVLCGHRAVSWPTFRKALACLFIKPFGSWDKTRALRARMQDLYSFIFQRTPTSFEHIRSDFDRAKCSNPRDRVYAMLQLLVPGERTMGIIPDYQLTPMAVFQDAVLRYTDLHQHLDLLRQCELHTSPPHPTWVPDWSTRGQAQVSIVAMAPSILRARYQYIAPSTLRVSGVSAAKIDYLHTFDSLDWGNHGLDICKAIQATLPSKDDIEAQGLQSVVDAYAQAYVCGDYAQAFYPPIPHLPTWRACTSTIEQLAQGKWVQHVALVADDLFVTHVRSLLAGRHFFRAGGFVGLCIASANVGDEVAVLLGCSTPMILRPVEGDQYLVVGEAFAHGMSRGEMVLGSLPLDVSVVRAEDETGTLSWFFQKGSSGDGSFVDPRVKSLFPDLETQPTPGATVRVDPTRLKERGIDVRDFDLV